MKKNETLTRRGFLTTSAAVTTGAMLTACGASKTLTNETKEEKIIYRTLGRTNLKLPIVSMGVMRADNPNLVTAALKLGMTHFDTAHVYQGGKNEEMVGNIFQNIPRDSFTMATKIHPGREQLSTAKFLEKLDISLKRLKMDYVDILYLHSAKNREFTLNEEYLNALTKAQEQGKTRYIGVSTHSHEPEVLQAAIDAKIYDVALVAYNFKQDHRKEMDEMIAKAANAGIGIVGMKTMAGGFLDKAKTKPVNCKAALKWALNNPNIHTTIPGFTTFDQLMENFSVMADLKLTADEEKDLALAFNESGLFCNGCKQCVAQCKKHLPIPDLMRAYMYNYGYNYPAKAKDTVAACNISNNPCEDCSECIVHCVKQFNVAEKIADISRIQHVPNEFLA
ncbi:oxidoreductase [Puteibacter caeruleilacunae]|nr:oxidoreductase [Puteibacter caeruleilacunae]